MLSKAGFDTFSFHNVQLLAVLTVLVGLWSITRPAMVRDYDNRPLPPNTTARFYFCILCVLTYLTLAASFLLLGESALTLITNLPGGKLVEGLGSDAPKFVHDQSPFFAVIGMAWLLQLRFFRDIERSVLIWLHSRRHTHDDLLQLAHQLEQGEFEPSDTERSRNRELVMRHGVHVTDDTFDAVGLVTYINWRKVSTLLRLLSGWNTEERRTLSRDEIKQLEELQKAHERKTQLQMTVVKMVDDVERGGGEASKALSTLLKLLTETPHLDRGKVAEVETKLKGMITDAPGDVSSRPLRLTGQQLKTYLQQIEGYFHIEYEILVQQAAMLAARSVVLSGELGPERLQQLKAAGFAGLGRVEQITFDRILWLFLVVAVSGFVVMYLGHLRDPNSNTAQSVEGIARFVAVMAFAALIGAAVGSRRQNANAQDPPWGRYFVAGLVAAALFFASNWVAIVVKNTLEIAPPPGQQPYTIARSLPWMVLPCFATMAIARLGRLERWPDLPGLEAQRAVVERVFDGLCVSLAVYLAFLIAVAGHAFGLDLPPLVKQIMEKTIPVIWRLQIFGFLIGFFVVRDVRRAAHATIVDAVSKHVPVLARAAPVADISGGALARGGAAG